MRVRNDVRFGCIILLAGAWYGLILADGGTTAGAPLFTLKNINGENYSLEANLGGGPIIINFWATWCGPCILEMKSMKKIYDRYSQRGMQVLSISIDDNKTSPQIAGVVRAYKIPYTILLDATKEVSRAFHVANAPHLFIIDDKGTIVYSHRGYQKGDERKVESIIKTLMPDAQ